MGRQLINGQASKALVAILTTVAAGLPIYYGTAKWMPIVVMGLGAVAVYLVPNQAAPKDVPAPPLPVVSMPVPPQTPGGAS